jgi:hypothetical protein
MKKKFTKIIVCGDTIVGIDKKGFVYREHKYDDLSIKSDYPIKNIYYNYSKESVLGLALDGLLFKFSSSYSDSFSSIKSIFRSEGKSKLRFKKIFTFPGLTCFSGEVYFGNTLDGVTYCWGSNRSGCLGTEKKYDGDVNVPIRFPYYLKKIVKLEYSSTLMALGYDYDIYDDRSDDTIYVWGERILKINSQWKKHSDIPDHGVIWSIRFTSKLNARYNLLWRTDDDMDFENTLEELFYGEKPISVRFHGASIKVKVIYESNLNHFAVDKDGKIYFRGTNTYQWLIYKNGNRSTDIRWGGSDDNDNDYTTLTRWAETIYSLEPRSRSKSKLFELLKLEKKCDVNFEFY